MGIENGNPFFGANYRRYGSGVEGVFFKSYKGTNLGYDMLCESVNSGQKEKEGDVLNGNHIINLDNLITNIDHFWCANNLHRRGVYR